MVILFKWFLALYWNCVWQPSNPGPYQLWSSCSLDLFGLNCLYYSGHRPWLSKTAAFHTSSAKALSLTGGANGKESACQYRRCKRRGFSPWVWKISWSGKRHPTPVFLLGKFHGQRSLAGCSPRGLKELDLTGPLSTHTMRLTLICYLQNSALLILAQESWESNQV